MLVKHRTSAGIVGTRMTYATHPFDVVGWDGCLYPYTFNIEDYMPITGKVHQPPPVHQVFEGWNFVVCNFLPRKVDYHELAIPVPYYHSNVDSDEVMFYVGGDYEARKGSGIDLGSISLHPGGYAHGPQPSAIEASLGVDYFEESAVMVDTFAPLELGEGGLAVEDPAYAWTWAGRGPDGTAATAGRRSSPTADRPYAGRGLGHLAAPNPHLPTGWADRVALRRSRRARARRTPRRARPARGGCRLDDAPVDHHRDAVGVVGGVQPVGDRHDGAALEQVVHRALERARGARVDERGRLVEHQRVRVGDDQPRQRDLLGLRRGERVAAGADHGVEALGQPLHPQQRPDRPQRLAHGLVVGVLAGQHDVVAHRADEDVVLLGDERDLGAQHLEGEVDQLDAADGGRAGPRAVDAREQATQGRLARAARPDDGEPLADAQRRSTPWSTSWPAR